MVISLFYFFRCDCDDCSACFNLPSELKRHKKTHKGPDIEHVLNFIVLINLSVTTSLHTTALTRFRILFFAELAQVWLILYLFCLHGGM